MNSVKFGIAALTVLCLGGCQNSSSGGATSAAASASAAPSAAAVAAPAAVTGDIPTSEDFEQQAEDEINPQNMETELDKLEKDISQ
jgi:hypothetical protein